MTMKCKGRPKVQNKKVTVAIRLPEDIVAELRTHKHYSRIIADYVMKGLASGELLIPGLSKTKATRSNKIKVG